MDEIKHTASDGTVALTAEIVSAFVSNNSVPITDLAALIGSVHAALAGLGKPATIEEPSSDKPTAAQIRKSITPDHLISFEDGKPYKALKRHLTRLDLTPDAYRAKWGLSSDYPMVAPSYSAQRSELARSLGLGQQRKKAAAAPEPTPEPVNDMVPEKPKRAGRPRKVKEEA